mmetsp:Transcript_60410/g.167296  ORF Transcript_60410/g.167296 Transcript_60410/m.167296 type:complete len:216 (-) Transcript_60410:809-1456(-)
MELLPFATPVANFAAPRGACRRLAGRYTHVSQRQILARPKVPAAPTPPRSAPPRAHGRARRGALGAPADSPPAVAGCCCNASVASQGARACGSERRLGGPTRRKGTQLGCSAQAEPAVADVHVERVRGVEQRDASRWRLQHAIVAHVGASRGRGPCDKARREGIRRAARGDGRVCVRRHDGVIAQLHALGRREPHIHLRDVLDAVAHDAHVAVAT